MNVNTVYINGKQVGKCTSTQIRPTGWRRSFPEYDVELIEFVYVQQQPQLNENQQIVLEFLKEKWNETQGQLWFPFEVLNSLHYQFDKLWGEMDCDEYCVIVKDKPYIEAYGDLTAVEQLEVLQAFSQWALEQEEE